MNSLPNSNRQDSANETQNWKRLLADEKRGRGNQERNSREKKEERKPDLVGRSILRPRHKAKQCTMQDSSMQCVDPHLKNGVENALGSGALVSDVGVRVETKSLW